MSDFDRRTRRLGLQGLNALRRITFPMAASGGASTARKKLPHVAERSVEVQSPSSDKGSDTLTQPETPLKAKAYTPPECFETYGQEQQYLAGLRNQGNVLLRLLHDDLDTTHYLQGFLCWSAAQDNIEHVYDLLANDAGKYPPLSMTYNNNAALYYAVINESAEVKRHLLEADVDPCSMLKAREHEKAYPLYQKRLNRFAQQIKYSECQTLSPFTGAWVPPSKNM